jgi:hypothetical protein
VLTGTTQ